MKTIAIANTTVVTLVDDDTYDKLMQWKWHLAKGYVQARVGADGPTFRMHQIVMNAPEGQQVDHIDRNPLNNQKGNLRCVTPSVNSQNKKQTNTPLGFLGVYLNRGKWLARIQHNHKVMNLGTYETHQEAAAVYDKKALELYGPLAMTNVRQIKEAANV